jgi:hypothetical protein
VRKFYFILALFAALLLGRNLRAADTYQLLDGKSVTGEVLPTGANEQGVQLKVGEGQYEKVPWTNFSQPDLKKFQANPKLAPLVEPYIEVTQEERAKKTEVVIKPPTRLERPSSHSFFGAMFTSSLGLFILAVLYAAIIYAGYEVAIFRAQPVPLVAGLSAIPFLGFFVPIIFLLLPTRVQAGTAEATPAGVEAAPGTPVAPSAPAQTFRASPAAAPHAAAPEPVNPMQAEVPHPSSGLHLAHDEPPRPAAPKYPPTQTFQRGQFTFNRRFIETKFAGFFGLTRKESDRDMLLIIKAVRGEYAGERISKITANDMTLEIKKGEASAEVVIPFVEIREIQLKHKDAP